MCGYFGNGFIDKDLLEHTYLLSLNDFEMNDEIILNYIQNNLNKLKCMIMFVMNVENLSKLDHEYKKYLKKKNQLKY